MKKLLFLGACLVALASQPVMAQTSPSVVLVRFSRTGTGNLRVAITRAVGKTEVSEVPAGYNGKGFVEASEGEYKVLYQLYQEGYQLLTSTQEYGGAVSWVFTKKQ